jgi:Leucine-rich repeat (LRR) protein
MSYEIIHISDEALKEQIIDNLPEGYKQINKSELEKVRTLYLNFCDLNNLHFLTHCKNLKSLSFLQTDDPLQPFHTLPYLPELKSLSIAFVNIPDLKFLVNCPNLTILELAVCGTLDISPINNLKKLKRLEIIDTDLAGCEKVNKNETLRSLSLHHLNIQHFPFRQFPNVKKFNCHEVKVDKITELFRG